jgi:hypothetical protein
MEAGDTSDQHLNVSDRQMHSLTANIQELARQSAADRREMQELTRQNQELIALLRSREKFRFPIPARTAEKVPAMKKGEIRIEIKITKEAPPIKIKYPV